MGLLLLEKNCFVLKFFDANYEHVFIYTGCNSCVLPQATRSLDICLNNFMEIIISVHILTTYMHTDMNMHLFQAGNQEGGSAQV